MPHTTHAYPFEGKVWAFVQELSHQLVGEGHHSFVMILSDDGAVRALHFECLGESWHTLTGKLNQEKTPYLFYDPFDAPEYAWLSWALIDRRTMERLMGGQFEEVDFAKLQYGAMCARALQPPGEFPTSWGVMF